MKMIDDLNVNDRVGIVEIKINNDNQMDDDII